MRLEAPSALEYFAALVAEDAHFPLLEAAALLGQDAEPGLDVQAVIDEVDRLGQRFCSRLPADASALHRLRMLNRYFFHELGFGGNANNFYDPQNSYLHRVLETRRGIPVSLAVLYLELATQAGLPALGVSFPGHFLVKLHLPAGEVLLDPLDGRSLSREELEERLEPFCQQRGLVGDDAVPLGLFLQAAPPRDILARMLGNLKSVHRAAGIWCPGWPCRSGWCGCCPRPGRSGAIGGCCWRSSGRARRPPTIWRCTCAKRRRPTMSRRSAGSGRCCVSSHRRVGTEVLRAAAPTMRHPAGPNGPAPAELSCGSRPAGACRP